MAFPLETYEIEPCAYEDLGESGVWGRASFGRSANESTVPAPAARSSMFRTKRRPRCGAAPIDCMGVPVARATFAEVATWFFEAAESRGREPMVLYFANADALNVAWRDPEYRAALCRADVVLNDGKPIDVYARVAGLRFEESFDALDVFPRLFAEADARRPLRVFLFGGAKGQAEKTAQAIHARFPNVRVVGTLDDRARGESAIEAINEACADVLLVGMTGAVQELWIDENKELLDVGIVAGVGALFESLAGAVTRVPALVRALGLEGAHRFACGSLRFVSRWLVRNPAFALRTLAYLGFGVAPRPVPF